ncbi:sensor histidine kinase [Chitinophaga agrisoli]|uniref:Sensor histidine kinase n=1 Tax=Chitinophaga agrisoli TaxID=2607653 RepID=A0A5B2VK59_9BACT|nr:histidine kinase [Chitinophaga agrisoli]KAA2239451.1 sensor histidine kinase [Chitinophaga agrisoli]
MMTVFLRYKLYHVLFWVIYLAFWTSYTMYSYGTPPGWALLGALIWFVSQGGTSYAAAYWLVPKYFSARRYGVFTLLLLAVYLAGVCLLMALFLPLVHYLGGEEALRPASFFGYALLANFYTLFLFAGVKAIKEKVQTDRRAQLLEKERTENELRFLKSQINPHFLFNAINSIYILIRKDPEFAAGTLARFADMLRYQLYECNAEEIPVEKEIAYLHNYVAMEKLRKGNSVNTRYQVEEQVQGFSIAPLLIIPFVENAFKYVSAFSHRDNNVEILLRYRQRLFELEVANTVDEHLVPPEDNLYGGIGLENVKRRLALIYNGRHQLQIDNSAGQYRVLLSIQTS